MNARILILFSLIFVGKLDARTKSNSSEELPFFKNNSRSFERIIDSYADSCKLLFDCANPNNLLIIGPRFLDDSIPEILISYVGLVEQNTMTEYKNNGYALLKVDNINVLIRKDALEAMNLTDSISFEGQQIFELNYGAFENCMISKDIRDLMHVTKVDGKLQISKYYKGSQHTIKATEKKKPKKWWCPF